MNTSARYLPQCLLHWLLWGAGRRGGLFLLVGWLGLVSVAAHAQRPILRLDISGGGPNTDQAYLYFEQGATGGFDSNFDAAKLPNPSGLNLASFDTDGHQLSINGLPPSLLTAPLAVPLFVGVPSYGAYTMQVGQLTDFNTTTVYLMDALLNTSSLLALGTTYTFDMTAANTSGTYATSMRFALQFVPGTGPLPVVLTSFTAVAQPAGVRVGWGTASELHSAYFAVERSPDGQAFGDIGRVAAAGTSAQAHTYALLDGQPLAGVAYYRLRQVDLDGSVQYSPVRLVAPPPTMAALGLFPNPAHSAATLLRAPPGAPVRVLDALGRLVATATADATGTAALVFRPGLPAGVYLVLAASQVVRLAVE